VTYVKKIFSNVKGGVACELGPKTLLTGKSGSGKSAVINAVELLVSGTASDIAGRVVVKKGLDLLALAPKVAKGTTLFAEGVLDSNEKLKFVIETNKQGGAKAASHDYPSIHVNPDLVLPLRGVRDALVGGPDTTREFFLPWVGGEVRIEDVVARIPEPLRELFGKLADEDKLAKTPVEKLISVESAASAKARSNSVAAKASEAVADEVGKGLPPPPTDAAYAERKSLEMNLRAQLEGIIAGNARLQAAGASQSTIGSLEAALLDAQSKRTQIVMQASDLQAQIQQADQTIAALPPMPQMTPAKQAIRDLLAYLVQTLTAQGQAGCECPLCGNQAALQTISERVAFLAKVDADRAQQHAQATQWTQYRNQLQSQLQFVTGQAPGIDARIAELEGQVAQARGALSQATGGAMQLVDPEPVRAQLAQVDQEVKAMETLRTQWAQARKAVSVSVEVQQSGGDFKLLAEACSKAIEQLVDAGRVTFVTQVQQYLPSTDLFDLQMRDGKREVCRAGLMKDGNLHTALSGAEWSRVTGALAASCAPKSGLAVVIPEERAFDPKTLGEVMEAFLKIPYQVILASPILPASMPAGWVVINAELGEHKKHYTDAHFLPA
jgi:energy-coupling factor transporter ATP-binding protein EcfA2